MYDRGEILAIIDAVPMCHVGVSTPDGPIVLPMAHGRDDSHLFLHGAAANGLLNAGVDIDVCATFTIFDGLVLARSAFHNSVNYRSAVVRGTATKLSGDEKLWALRRISDHIVPTWDEGRPSSEAEIRGTIAISVPLAEMSAKRREGDPVDEPEDLQGPWWSGTVPLEQRWGTPMPAADLTPGIEVPPRLEHMRG